MNLCHLFDLSLVGRREREACLALRFGRVSLRRPGTADSKLAANVDMFVVDVTEVDPPPGVEPLHWRLLTTHEVTTVAEAKEIVRFNRLLRQSVGHRGRSARY